jgi:hypothetical protein
MRRLMTKFIPLLILAAAPSLAADPENMLCTLDDKSRSVQIVRDAGVSVPCEVHYDRDTYAPGDPEVLWRANHEAGFCEARAAELIAKLEALGWSCAKDTRTEEDDDAADLAPIGEIEISGSETR